MFGSRVNDENLIKIRMEYGIQLPLIYVCAKFPEQQCRSWWKIV